MRYRVVGGIAVWLLCIVSLSACVFGVPIHVNDVLLSLEHPALVEAETVLVPIQEFGAAIGIETVVEQGRLVLRWAGMHRTVDPAQHAFRDGVPYVALGWIVGLVDGEIHRVGDAWYVTTTVASLHDVEATSTRVVLRFNRFVPIDVGSVVGGELFLTIRNCDLGISPRLIVLGSEGIESVHVPSNAPGCVPIRIALQDGITVRTRTYESSDFYSFCIEVADIAEEEKVIQLGQGMLLHEAMRHGQPDPTRIAWVYVEAWRENYRLAPTLHASGHSGLGSMEELADAGNAIAAVNLGCARISSPLDLLVIDGVPYTFNGGTHHGLGLDLFGLWQYFSDDTTICAKHKGERIALDGVNRPLLYGEVVAYPPGYAGEIARGVPGSFLVVKTREEHVVSVYQGPFVTGDPTATLVVASGDAKARLSLVRLGDVFSLECGVGADRATYTHAFSAGPVLIDSGVVASDVASSAQEARAEWAVVATDWHGGLIFLLYSRETGDEVQTADELISFLGAMTPPIRDAIVVGRCGANAVVIRDASSVYRLGSGDLYAAALCLVPLSP